MSSALVLSGCGLSGMAHTASPAAVTPAPVPTQFAPALNATTVFMGDSITAYWPLPLHNKGVPGERANAMLLRFQTDVLGQGYQRVVILAGTNDERWPDATIPPLENIDAMATVAVDAGIEPVLCLVPPLQVGEVDLNAQVDALNLQIAALAKAKGYLLVDYNTPLRGHPEDFVDGIHPNAAGYVLMEAALSGVVVK